MKIEKRKLKGDIVQITTLDERWYEKNNIFYPSSTWIAGHYPKGIAFYKWLANNGWDEAESIKQAAGNKGSKVHNAIEKLCNGETVRMDDKLPNNNGDPEELTVEEYEAIMSFVDWYKSLKNPKILKTEHTVINEKVGYAGTLDLLIEIDGEKWIVDFKTSASIWPEYRLQISSYKHCGYENTKMGILQIGYKLNKRGWKFNEIEDQFDLFLHAKAIWENENKNVQPKQKDYPIEIKIGGE
jgi:hypothetical protein